MYLPPCLPQDNKWFQAMDAKTLDQLITEMNTMNKYFGKVGFLKVMEFMTHNWMGFYDNDVEES